MSGASKSMGRMALYSVISGVMLLGAVGVASAQVQPIPDDAKSFSDQFLFNAEYRARYLQIDPLELNGDSVTRVNWTEQRFRLDGQFIQPRVGRIVIQADALDGVLWGDNGQFGGSPSSNSGVSLSAKRPNLTRWRVGLPEGSDSNPLDPESYQLVLEEADLLEINYLYADILLPIGLLRVGRQPLAYGATITGHDGGNWNRFGVSQFSDGVDRILFGTKLDQAFYMATTPGHVVDTSLNNGLILGLFYDISKQDSPMFVSDNLTQKGVALEFRKDKADWGGLNWEDFFLGLRFVVLNNEEFETDIMAFPTLFSTQIENIHLSFQLMYIHGQTREVSEGFAILGSDEPTLQQIRAWGAQAIADVDLGRAMISLEFDYASGDDDPTGSTPITSFNFARDMNVGLLLFEHIMAFESARSVAVGLENLSGLDSPSFPLTEVQSDGRFNNAIAIFPQLYVRLLETAKNRMWLRTGVLMAWPDANGVIDPVMSILGQDGESIEDDLVNFHGGDPGSYYGTEVDAQLGWNIQGHFDWVVEGAVLFPGDALQDQNGDAVNTYMFENRFVFNF